MTPHAVAPPAVTLQLLAVSLWLMLRTHLWHAESGLTLLQDPRLGGKKVLNHEDVITQIEGWIARGAFLTWPVRRYSSLHPCQAVSLTLRPALTQASSSSAPACCASRRS